MEKARRHKFHYMWVVAVCWVHLQATVDPPWIEADEELQPIRLDVEAAPEVLRFRLECRVGSEVKHHRQPRKEPSHQEAVGVDEREEDDV